MKKRTGFVSNSSSSSFVINLPKPIEEYTLEEFQSHIEDWTECSDILFEYLQRKTDLDDIDDDDIYISFQYSLRSYEEKLTSEQFKELKKIIVKYLKDVESKTTRYRVEYGDECGNSDMENFMYELHEDYDNTGKNVVVECNNHH